MVVKNPNEAELEQARGSMATLESSIGLALADMDPADPTHIMLVRIA